MDFEAVLLLALVSAALFIAWGWRRIGTFTFGTNQHSTAPFEPCWTEEIGRDGGHIYGQSHCVDDDLMDADAQAGRDEFRMPYPY